MASHRNKLRRKKRAKARCRSARAFFRNRGYLIPKASRVSTSRQMALNGSLVDSMGLEGALMLMGALTMRKRGKRRA